MRTTLLPSLALLLSACGTALPITQDSSLPDDAATSSDGGSRCKSAADCGKPNTDCCAGTCIDVSADPANCGGCAKACHAVAHGTPTCAAGQCAATCDTGFADCDQNAQNGCETDTTSDAMNCGACNKPCPAVANGMAACKSGLCTPTCNAGFADCDNSPGNGCETNLATDKANCGACGMACGALAHAQTTCSNNMCAILGCDQGYADCDNKPLNGCESNLAADPANCGGCAKSCPNYPNAAPVCANGGCSLGTCKPGFADCDNLPGNGCEVPVDSDLANCGGCGKVCATAHATPACVMSACTISACAMGYSDCDKMAATGCEVQIATDPANCGMCGKACPVPANAAASCVNGACGAACKFGFGDCNKNLGDGCEAALATDVTNCGQCGMQCAVYPNSTPSCTAGQCGIAMCQGLFGNCDNVLQNGCEKALAADINNCGACGKVCNFQNGQGACLNGQCGLFSCTNGFGNCDANDANGCESDFSSDKNNCGKCGMACPLNMPFCSNGVCVPGVTYSATFTNGQTPVQECTDWNTFRATLNGNYTSITIKGSVDNVGVTCLGANANLLCLALKNAQSFGPVACSGRNWGVGLNCGPNGSVELTADGTLCQCFTPGYTVRPCIGNQNWGGAGTPTCGGPTQTMTVICQ